MWPFSTEVSLTTSVYFVFSRSAVRVRKSSADLSIMPSTASVVAFPPCAAGLWWVPAEREAAHHSNAGASAAASQILFFKMSPWGQALADVFRSMMLAHSQHIERCADGQERFGTGSSGLAANLDLIRDNVSVSIADRIN